MSHHLLRLRDGRTLAYRMYGLQTGLPVVFAHGNLNSRLFQPSWERSTDEAVDAGACVIALDRPGYGRSTTHPGRTYLDFAADVKELVLHLKLDRFALVGFSSGGPHALAAASLLSRDVDVRGAVASCGVVSSDAPYHRMGGDALVERMYGAPTMDLTHSLTRAERNAAHLFGAYERMQHEARRKLALSDIEEAMRQGVEGAASDSFLEASEDWRFDLRPDPSIPVFIWHGTDDEDVPVDAARFLANEISVDEDHLMIVRDENHTLIRRKWGEILQKMADSMLHSCIRTCFVFREGMIAR